MGGLFSYYEGCLSDFLAHIKQTNDNSLVKIKLEARAPGSFRHVLDSYAVKHIFTKHSNEKEILHGQIVIEESDFLLITDILNNYDTRETVTGQNGRTLYIYSKTYTDCKRYYVEEVRKGRYELAGVTYYKRKRKLTGAKS